MVYNRIKYINGDLINGIHFVKEVQSIKIHRAALFLCRCGNYFECRINNIKTGVTKSCGCALIEHCKKRRKERKQVLCKCGCGNNVIGVDTKGRDRKYIHGHNKGHDIPHTKDSIEIMRIRATGKTVSIETRRKQSINGNRGEKNNNWKGGVTPINEKIRKSIDYKIWRKSVFDRDNYTCQQCGEKENVSGKLEADHIKPFAYFPQLRFAIYNGRTLCKECHKKTDTYLVKAQQKYGRYKQI